MNRLDAIALEPQFLAHIAPVWLALPPHVRGRCIIDRGLMDQAAGLGIDADPIDAMELRQTPQRAPVHDGIRTLVASIGDIKVGRRMGHGPFIFLEHGAGQSYDGSNATMASYPGGPDRADNELFLVPNEYSADRWRRAYPSAEVEVVGSPRLDGLPRKVGTGRTVAISFHGDWPMGVPYGGNALPDFVGKLAELRDRFDLIGHCHPRADFQTKMRRVYGKLGIPFVADFDDVCREASVYVCDNSTTIFEFASTGRPVVLMNARVWHRKGGPGLRFWDAAHVGINVGPDDDLPAAIEEALADSPARQTAREDALGIVYAFRRGAAERAAAAVSRWLAGRVEVAA